MITLQRIVTTLILVEAEPLRNFAKTKGMTLRSSNAMEGMLSGSTSFTKTILNMNDSTLGDITHRIIKHLRQTQELMPCSYEEVLCGCFGGMP